MEVGRHDPVRIGLPGAPPEPDQLLTVEEAAAEAGGVHPRSIRRAIKSGMLHAFEFRTAPQARPMYRIRRHDLWR